MDTKHSPLPWRAIPYGDAGEQRRIVDARGGWVADAYSDTEAALIVEAVNSHAALQARVKELEGALYRMCNLFLQEGPKDAYEWAGYQHARALLAKGEQS